MKGKRDNSTKETACLRRRGEAKFQTASHTGSSGTGGEQQGLRRAAVLLFKADVSQVSIIDTDDAVVLLEEALLLSFPSPFQTLDQQAKSPEMFKSSGQ